MASALDGITVVDLTSGAAGAICTMFLSDNGARVIRVELPESEGTRDAAGYKLWDRGKESVELDIASSVAAFHKLVRMADVLVDSFTPSSPYQRLMDYDLLSTINPKLVHCSITAYGKTGPLKDEPPDDDLVMAATGVQVAQPGFRDGPVHVAHPVPTVGAALLAAQGIVAALYAREKTYLGRKVETSLMAGALMYSPKVVGEHLTPRPFQPTPAGGGPFYSVFECADGEYIQLGCIHSGFVDIASAVMDLADVMMDPRYGDGRMPRDEAARRELFGIVAAVMKSRPSSEWEELFDAADVPHGRCCTTDDSFDNPQVKHLGIACEIDDPEVGRVVEMAPPIRFSVTGSGVRGPRPLRGQHTAKVLAELEEIAAPSVNAKVAHAEVFDPPLSGIRVLEMTNVIAGPTAGKLLADLGADVIKLEPPYGDISRPSNMTYFYYLNSQKRSISVNTRTPEGREAARRIARGVDVMVANMRPGATDRMGLDSEWLHENNPGIIQAHVTAFGWDGPFSHRPGVDPLAQAWMGLQFAQGGHGNPPVFLSQLAPTDFTAGAMGALGALMALYVRERGGPAQTLDTNLLYGGALLCMDGFMRYEGKPPRRIANKGQHGLSALHRLYRTSEGWFYLSAESDSHWQALCRAIGQPKLVSDRRFSTVEARTVNDEALAALLESALRSRSACEWLRTLKAEGVPCALADNWHDGNFFANPHVQAAGLEGGCQHPVLGRMKYARSATTFGSTRPVQIRCTPLLGQHTREVLTEVGYTEAEIDALYDKSIALTEKPSS